MTVSSYVKLQETDAKKKYYWTPSTVSYAPLRGKKCWLEIGGRQLYSVWHDAWEECWDQVCFAQLAWEFKQTMAKFSLTYTTKLLVLLLDYQKFRQIGLKKETHYDLNPLPEVSNVMQHNEVMHVYCFKKWVISVLFINYGYDNGGLHVE